MFSNRVTSRELFANSSSEKHDFSEHSDGFSQLQNSQFDFTQYSQDFGNSQQQSSGSDSQGRKVFEKYMASTRYNQAKSGNVLQGAPKLAGNNNRSTTTRPNFQQQLQINKARAKEKDERDLLSSIVNIVKDCSDEVKNALSSMSKGLGQALDNSDEKLLTSVNKVSEIVSESFDKMIQAVKERDDRRSKTSEMEKEISNQESKIRELKQELCDLRKEKENQTVNALKDVLNHHQSNTEHKLQHLVDIAKEQLENQKLIISAQSESNKDNVEIHRRFQKENQQLYENTEKRLLDEVMQLREDLERHKGELEDLYKSQIQSLKQKQSMELQKQIQNGLEKSVQISHEQSKDLWKIQYNQLNELCKTQQTEIESYIRTQVAEQTRFQQYQFEKQSEKQANHFDRHTELITDQVIAELKSNESKRKWEFHDSVPKSLQNQLEMMHKNYQAELAKIRKEMTSAESGISCVNKTQANINDYGKDMGNEEIMTCKSFHKDGMAAFNACDGLNKQSEILEKCRNGTVSFTNKTLSSFRSPSFSKSGWNSRTLFSRTNPSPVAAVKPQPQTTNNENKRKTCPYDQARGDSQTENVNRQQQTSDVAPLRRSQRLLFSKSSSPPENNNLKNIENSSQKYGQNNRFERIDIKKENTFLDSEYQNQLNSKQLVSKDSGKTQSNGRMKPFMENGHRSQNPMNRDVTLSIEAVKQKYVNSTRKHTTDNKKETGFSSVFDFHEENSTLPWSSTVPHQDYTSKRVAQNTSWKFNKGSSRNGNSEENKLAGRLNSDFHACSRDSSPSMSITKIMIEKKIKPRQIHEYLPSSSESDERSPYKTKSSHDYRNAKSFDDFLSMPNLEDNQQVQVKKVSRSGQKRRLFHFALSPQTAEIMSSLKYPKKRRI